MAWRTDAVVVGAIIAAIGLLVLMRKMQRRTAQVGHQEREEVDRYLRRTDLMEGDAEPENVFEWVIKFSTLPKAQILLLILVAVAAGAAAVAGYTAIAAVGGFFAVLALLMLLLFTGWDRLETYFGTGEIDESKLDNRIHYGTLPEHVKQRLQEKGVSTEDTATDYGKAARFAELKIVTILTAVLFAILVVFEIILRVFL